jgi:hypothetical protein
MGETWRGLIMDFAANSPRYSMPTHTHDFDNNSDGYSHLKTALVWHFSGQPEIGSFNGFETRKQFRNLVRITTFKIFSFLFD